MNYWQAPLAARGSIQSTYTRGMGKVGRRRATGERSRELRERAERKRAALAARQTVNTVPIWEYRAAAEAAAAAAGIEPAAMLSAFMEGRALMKDAAGREWDVVPAASCAEAGRSFVEYVDSYRVLHEIGAVEWDAEALTHVWLR